MPGILNNKLNPYTASMTSDAQDAALRTDFAAYLDLVDDVVASIPKAAIDASLNDLLTKAGYETVPPRPADVNDKAEIFATLARLRGAVIGATTALGWPEGLTDHEITEVVKATLMFYQAAKGRRTADGDS